MKALGITMSAWSVGRIQADAKTQTRRPIKPQPLGDASTSDEERVYLWPPNGPGGWQVSDITDDGQYSYHDIRAPYGPVGRVLYVKQPHWRGGAKTANDQVWDEFSRTTRWADGREITDHTLALDDNGRHVCMRRKSPRFMPKWAARLWLRVTDIRVQRVQDISEEDACAEGCVGWNTIGKDIKPTAFPGVESMGEQVSPGGEFQQLWQSIYAKSGRGWDANPWVFAYSFTRVDKP